MICICKKTYNNNNVFIIEEQQIWQFIENEKLILVLTEINIQVA